MEIFEREYTHNSTLENPNVCPKCLHHGKSIRYAPEGTQVMFFADRSFGQRKITETEGFICGCDTCDFEWWEYL